MNFEIEALINEIVTLYTVKNAFFVQHFHNKSHVVGCCLLLLVGKKVISVLIQIENS